MFALLDGRLLSSGLARFLLLINPIPVETGAAISPTTGSTNSAACATIVVYAPRVASKSHTSSCRLTTRDKKAMHQHTVIKWSCIMQINTATMQRLGRHRATRVS